MVIHFTHLTQFLKSTSDNLYVVINVNQTYILRYRKTTTRACENICPFQYFKFCKWNNRLSLF